MVSSAHSTRGQWHNVGGQWHDMRSQQHNMGGGSVTRCTGKWHMRQGGIERRPKSSLSGICIAYKFRQLHLWRHQYDCVVTVELHKLVSNMKFLQAGFWRAQGQVIYWFKVVLSSSSRLASTDLHLLQTVSAVSVPWCCELKLLHHGRVPQGEWLKRKEKKRLCFSASI